MTGPQVRGDIRVSRVVQSRNTRAGVKTVIANGVTPPVVEVADPRTIIVNDAVTATNTTLLLPIVDHLSSVTTSTTSPPTTITIPGGAVSGEGIGSEFKIFNNCANNTVTVLDSNANNVQNPEGTSAVIPPQRTATVYCSAVTQDSNNTPTWEFVLLDAVTGTITAVTADFTAGTSGTPAAPALQRWFDDTTNNVFGFTFPATGGTTTTQPNGSHGKGVNPTFIVYDTTSGNRKPILIDTTLSSSGSITILVDKTPSSQTFAGVIEVW